MTWTLPWAIWFFCDVSELECRFFHRISGQNSFHCLQVLGFLWHCVETDWFSLTGVFLDIKEKRRVVFLCQFGPIIRSESWRCAPVCLFIIKKGIRLCRRDEATILQLNKFSPYLVLSMPYTSHTIVFITHAIAIKEQKIVFRFSVL